DKIWPALSYVRNNGHIILFNGRSLIGSGSAPTQQLQGIGWGVCSGGLRWQIENVRRHPGVRSWRFSEVPPDKQGDVAKHDLWRPTHDHYGIWADTEGLIHEKATESVDISWVLEGIVMVVRVGDSMRYSHGSAKELRKQILQIGF
ncbi:hypothetical protein Bpfe_030338, partial [Biomphalaria pfeifferi]